MFVSFFLPSTCLPLNMLLCYFKLIITFILYQIIGENMPRLFLVGEP